jgi:hypothetical protein
MMSIVKMAIHAISAAKVIGITITALVSTAPRTGVQSPVIPTLRAATASELRRQGTCQIPPQYLPTLPQVRSLRLRAVHRPMATPVEVRSLSELRWRRFSRQRH